MRYTLSHETTLEGQSIIDTKPRTPSPIVIVCEYKCQFTFDALFQCLNHDHVSELLSWLVVCSTKTECTRVKQTFPVSTTNFAFQVQNRQSA